MISTNMKYRYVDVYRSSPLGISTITANHVSKNVNLGFVESYLFWDVTVRRLAARDVCCQASDLVRGLQAVQ